MGSGLLILAINAFAQHGFSGIRNSSSSFEDIQCLGFFNHLTALADLELPVEVAQVCIDGGR
jgi:hypothetical protein